MNVDDLKVIERYNKEGIYGLISELEEINLQTKPREKAYNLLKWGYKIAKKSHEEKLGYLPCIAFDLSRHHTIYRMAGLIYFETGNIDKACECLSYLDAFYAENQIETHKQFTQLYEHLLSHFPNKASLRKVINKNKNNYEALKALNSLKEFGENIPTEDIDQQKVFFETIYQRYGREAVIQSIKNDIRFKDREKAILLIRASKAIGLIDEEGPSIESIFADEAIGLDTSDTVVNNVYHAYLRAGDLNKIEALKNQYPSIISS